jgi:hypothetical protein
VELGDGAIFESSSIGYSNGAHFFGSWLWVTEVAAVREIFDWAMKLPNVTDGRIDIIQDVISSYEVYKEQLEKLLTSRYHAPSASSISLN